MANDPKLVAEKRVKLGTAECRRLRRQGLVPGNVYGHQQDPVAFSVSADILTPILHSGHKVVDLEMGSAVEKAMFREVQWDTFGQVVQHFDLVRVDANERVTVDVAIVLRGNAPGVLSGGMLEQHLHSLTLDCPAIEIPERITVRISELEIGGVIHVSDLELPGHTHVQTTDDTVVVRVVEAVAEEEDVEGEAGPAQPELVGRKDEGEEDGE